MLLQEAELDEKKLRLFIEQKREEMTDAVNKNGFVCDETIRISQELDRLINLYQKTTI
jgi:hypothetical protein